MIKVENMSFSFPDKDLYNKVSFHIRKDAHCALIGSNGTGKSTFVKMLLDPENYMYDGKIKITNPKEIGYVSQFSVLDSKESETVYEYISEEFVRQQQEIEALCTTMETAENMELAFEQYQQALDTFTAIDGDFYDSNIKKQLKLAGLEKIEKQTITSISNGEFKLVQIIRQMLLSPGMLILDEPDVFLDFEHLNALVDLINAHHGTLLVITHNRYLLNHCFNQILHMENTAVYEYDGDYAHYHYELLETKIAMQEQHVKDAAEIERNAALVAKLRAKATAMDNASLGRSVHARQTILDRLIAGQTQEPFVDVFMPEIHFHTTREEEDVTRELSPKKEIADLEKTQDSPVILHLQDYSAAFGEQLLEHINLEIHAGDKVAIIGGNGTGKTTLLRDVMEQKKASVILDTQAKLAMFTQDVREAADEKNTRSGGERDLAQLDKIASQPVDLLLLDEPSAHLDLNAQQALEQALEEYQGTVLMVSHDFYMVANAMDYVLLVEDKGIRTMSIRRFRQMIYANHFDKEYLILEQQKKEVEKRINALLAKKDYEHASQQLEKLKSIIDAM